MVRRSLQYYEIMKRQTVYGKRLPILGCKSQGTTPGNCKVTGSNLQSELIFRICNYEFAHRNNRLGSPQAQKLPSILIPPRGKFTADQISSESNDRIESWRMEARARLMDARDWVALPVSVLLPTVPSYAVDLIVPSAHCCCAARSTTSTRPPS